MTDQPGDATRDPRGGRAGEDPSPGADGTAEHDHVTTRRSLLAAAASTTAASAAGCASITTPADVASEAEIPGNVSYFVGPGTVADRLGDLVPVDARSRERYRHERVYGARHLPLDGLTVGRESAVGAVPDADAIARVVGRAGITPDDDVVVYGGSVGSRVTRVVFALQYLGHDGDVLVMNGGFRAWNGRVGTGRRASERDPYEPDPASDLVVTRDWLAEHLGTLNTDGGPGLLDVRHPDAYLAATGSDRLDPENDRQGHVPGAVDVHWVGNVDGRTLTNPGDLFDLYSNRAGLPEERPVVVYGQENVDPTNTWVVLRALGFTDVRLYDGGFAEWANVPESRRGDYPVETKTHTVVETEGEVGGDDDGGFSCTG